MSFFLSVTKKIIILSVIFGCFLPLRIFAQAIIPAPNIDAVGYPLPDAVNAPSGEQSLVQENLSTTGDYRYCTYKTTGGQDRCTDISDPGIIYGTNGLSEADATIECDKLCQSDPEGKQVNSCHIATDCREGYVSKPTKLENPLGSEVDFSAIAGTAIKSALGVVGALTLAVFVYGGFMWITSAGNEEKVRMGSAAMLYAVIGIFIIFASYGILSLIFTRLTGGA
jgi:hypothetical protein